jgi:hypothetical protein
LSVRPSRPNETEEKTEAVAEVNIDQTREEVIEEATVKIAKLTGLRILEGPGV